MGKLSLRRISLCSLVFASSVAIATLSAGPNFPRSAVYAGCPEPRGFIDRVLRRRRCSGGPQAPICSIWPSSTEDNVYTTLRTRPTFIWKVWKGVGENASSQRVQRITVKEFDSGSIVFEEDFTDGSVSGVLRSYGDFEYYQEKENNLEVLDRGGYWKIESFTPELDQQLVSGAKYTYSLSIISQGPHRRRRARYSAGFQVMPDGMTKSNILNELRNLSAEITPDLLKYIHPSDEYFVNTDLLRQEELASLQRVFYLSGLEESSFYAQEFEENGNYIWADLLQEIFSISRPTPSFRESIISPIETPEICAIHPVSFD